MINSNEPNKTELSSSYQKTDDDNTEYWSKKVFVATTVLNA